MSALSRRVCLVVVSLVSLAVCFGLFAHAAQDQAQHRATPLEKLRSPVASERALARGRLTAQYAETIDSLLQIVVAESPERHIEYERIHAIELLGRYRAVSAINALVERLEYSPPWIIIGELHPLNPYPAAKALVEIGSPCLCAITARLTKPATDNQLRIFAWVVYLIDGKEVGLYRLQHTLAETNPGFEQKRENFTRLIEIYQAPDFKSMKNWPRPEP